MKHEGMARAMSKLDDDLIYYDRRKCTSPVHSSELPHKVIQANWQSFHIRR